MNSPDRFESARSIDQRWVSAGAAMPDYMISADSHATEPESLWDELPSDIRKRLPLFIGRGKRPDGASDPKFRLRDMDEDKLAAEVMYPDHGLAIFAGDPDVQKAAFRLYNDWLADFCKAAPKRLFGITCLQAYDIDEAIREMQRGYDMGLYGGLIWQVPDPKLPFSSLHYEKLWSAAEEMNQPINLHILTGFNYARTRTTDPTQRVREQANIKMNEINEILFDFVWTGVFERHPKLKLGLIESEIGWLPFLLQQWDYYFDRNRKATPDLAHYKINRLPSEIFQEHVYATFMDDQVGCKALNEWGERNCMWSSDYPHPNMTWPDSRAFAARQIGALPREKQERLLSRNVIELYGLKV
jgi:predicted TIM-barrel fold metal-dependent hydrolase